MSGWKETEKAYVTSSGDPFGGRQKYTAGSKQQVGDRRDIQRNHEGSWVREERLRIWSDHITYKHRSGQKRRREKSECLR